MNSEHPPPSPMPTIVDGCFCGLPVSDDSTLFCSRECALQDSINSLTGSPPPPPSHRLSRLTPIPLQNFPSWKSHYRRVVAYHGSQDKADVDYVSSSSSEDEEGYESDESGPDSTTCSESEDQSVITPHELDFPGDQNHEDGGVVFTEAHRHISSNKRVRLDPFELQHVDAMYGLAGALSSVGLGDIDSNWEDEDEPVEDARDISPLFRGSDLQLPVIINIQAQLPPLSPLNRPMARRSSDAGLARPPSSRIQNPFLKVARLPQTLLRKVSSQFR